MYEFPLASEILSEPLDIQEGSLHVSRGPGLGVSVDEERVKAESFKFWEAPHLRRRDGSFTNW